MTTFAVPEWTESVQVDSSPFEQPAYLRRCHNIAKALEYALPWGGIETILDLGCGFGAVGGHFVNNGLKVSFVDGRRENVEELRSRGLPAILHDAQTPLLPEYRVDLILCMGLLYHSEDPQRILMNCADIAPIIAVETLCMDQEDCYLLSFEEDTKRHDQSLDGGCCRFSPSWLERALRRAGYNRIEDVPNVSLVLGDGYHQGFIYDWEVRNSGESYRDGYGLRKLMIGYRDDAY